MYCTSSSRFSPVFAAALAGPLHFFCHFLWVSFHLHPLWPEKSFFNTGGILCLTGSILCPAGLFTSLGPHPITVNELFFIFFPSREINLRSPDTDTNSSSRLFAFHHTLVSSFSFVPDQQTQVIKLSRDIFSCSASSPLFPSELGELCEDDLNQRRPVTRHRLLLLQRDTGVTTLLVREIERGGKSGRLGKPQAFHFDASAFGSLGGRGWRRQESHASEGVGLGFIGHAYDQNERLREGKKKWQEG